MRVKELLIMGCAVLVISLLVYLSLPRPLFSDPLSTVVYDRDGQLLGARIARDGQWRFPGLDSIPEKYKCAVLNYEDRYFFLHPGVNPVSMFRALGQNIRAGEITSGGSTITMQVMRMSRKNKPRNLYQKMVESLLALRLEITESKSAILTSYANHAPFGGNVVGLEAAAWRYFGTDPWQLTWAESALLAVLPNAPSLIHPGRNREALLQKRNKLLTDLYTRGEIDKLTLQLALEEPLPLEPIPLPNYSPHLTDRIMLDENTNTFYSTIDKEIQVRVNELASIRQERLSANKIHNMACIVMEVESGSVLAYYGNSSYSGTIKHGQSVDVIQSKRSTGSILKPILFAGMLDNGDILQTQLIPDVPIRYNGYAPKNYDRGYNGAVPAYKALERSLNIPAVILLRNYGVEPFLSLLRRLRFSTFRYNHEHYGLTLILGGAETTLWELTGIYGSMARVLNHYTESDGNYFTDDYSMPVLERKTNPEGKAAPMEEGLLSASSIYLTFESLLQVNRPEELSLWYLMSSSRKIAWKTGTSYGSRDAWAIGISPEYLVGVWAGNADGEGRPGLSGLSSAAPLMFDVFSVLPETSWFSAPLDDLTYIEVCRQSGYLAGPHCLEKDTIPAVPKGAGSKVCPYHRLVHLDESGQYRVSSDCYPLSQMHTTSWFILPPLMEWYYKRSDPSYLLLPPMLEGCSDDRVEMMEIVYPERNSHLVIPRELDGSMGKVIMEVAHRKPALEIYWHIDERYVGTTKKLHQLGVDLIAGKHKLTVVDAEGHSQSVTFEVLK